MAKTLVTLLISCVAALMLCGCSSDTHRILDGENCIQCHPSSIEHDPVTIPDAEPTTLKLSLDTDEPVVYLCTARYGGDDGSKIVPVKFKTLSPSDYDSVVLPTEGTYLLCTGDEESPTITPIVAKQGDEVTTVEL